MAVKVDDLTVQTEVLSETKKASAAAPDNIGKAAVIGIAVAATLALLPWLGKSMFADEGATLYSAHLSWSNLWSQSLHVDLVLLPYYVLVHFWVMVSGNIEFVRALSLFAYFGTIMVVGIAGLRTAGRWCGIIAAALTATSTLLVLKSLNARPYDLSALLVALCAVSLINWIRDPRARWLWAFSLFSILAAAMQLFALLAPLSMLFCVLVVRPRLITRRLRVLLAPMAILAVASGAWIIACKGEVGQVNWIANGSQSNRLLTELRGPVIGILYDCVILVILILAVAKLAAVWDRDVRSALAEQISQDRDFIALTVGWAVLPTVVLSLASFAHPIYANRYVTASAPGVALLVAFICVRAFPANLDRARSPEQKERAIPSNRIAAATTGAIACIALLLANLGSASALQEDLQSPARFAAHHQRNGDVIALPDHAITAAIDYYEARGSRSIPHWPQVGVGQRYVEGLALSLHPTFTGGLPQRVWLVTDGSVPGVVRFQRALHQDRYTLSEDTQFTGVSLLLYTLTPRLGIVAPRRSIQELQLVRPTSGAVVRGRYDLDASAQSGVTKVQFEVTGRALKKAIIGRATSSPLGWYYQWHSRQVANGTYTVRAIGFNAAEKRIRSKAATLRVAN